MPAFATLTGFARGGASLNAAQLERVKRAAEFIAQSWRSTSPITSIRITGYIDANEGQSDLGQRRAVTVRDALLRALGSARPGLATRLRWIVEDRGFSPVAKVEIYLWHGPTPPPAYVSTYGGLGRVPMLHVSLAGPLGASPLTPALQDFLNQVKLQPKDFKKLLLNVALHPSPTHSRAWNDQTFTFNKQTRHLLDEIVISGQSGEVVVRNELMRIAFANFKQEIEAEWRLQNDLIKTTRALGPKKLKPFLVEPLFPPTPPEPEEYKLARVGLYFAGFGLPHQLAQRIINSEASEAHSIRLGNFLRGYAKDLLPDDPALRALVEQERKKRQQRRRKP
jgi:hypothetical protein